MPRASGTSERLLTRTRLRDLLDRHGVEPSRALGQNFVVDPNTVRRIARLSGVGPGDHVVEIGAGLGSLTLALVETGATVVAVEADRHLLAPLAEVLGGRPVRVVHADARTMDWDDALAGAPSWALVANLPYNVATPLVLQVLEEVPRVERLLVMVQREVGERLAAGPGSRTYGIPSVMVALRARAEVVGRVPAEVFLPRPRVASVLVRLDRLAEPPTDADPEVVGALVRQAFGTRRKMLRRSLRGTLDDDAIRRAGIEPDARPEQLGVEAWGRLAHEVGR